MCLIIETQKSITIPRFVMQDMFKHNSDGFGFMYIRNGHSIGEKFHSNNLDELYERYLALQDDEPFIHLRMKTHGDINQENSHPYYCDHGVWLMHNGVMSECQGEDKTKSDTWYFANEYIKPLLDHCRDPEIFIRTRAFKELITKFIGGSNRIVLADRKGTLRFNPNSWHTITNEETKCVGMRVSNTYAWSLHTKHVPYEPAYHRKHSYSRIHTRTYNPPHPSPTRLSSHKDDPIGSFRDMQDNLWVCYGDKGWCKADVFGFIGSQEATLSPPTSASNNERSSSNNTTSHSANEGEVTTWGKTYEKEIMRVFFNNNKNGISVVPSNDDFKDLTYVPSNGSGDHHEVKAECNLVYEDEELDDEHFDDITPEEKEAAESVWKESYWDYLQDTFMDLTYTEIYDKVAKCPDEGADFIALVLGVDIDHEVLPND